MALRHEKVQGGAGASWAIRKDNRVASRGYIEYGFYASAIIIEIVLE